MASPQQAEHCSLLQWIGARIPLTGIPTPTNQETHPMPHLPSSPIPDPLPPNQRNTYA